MKSVFFTVIKKSIIVVATLIICFLSGCKKETYPEEKRIEDYEINRENSLKQFSAVMYNDSDNIHKELFKIVHISDAHISPWSCSNHFNNPQNLAEAVRFVNEATTRMNAMVATGDHINNDDKTTRSEAIHFLNVFTNTLYKNNRIPTFISTGNHDVNMLNLNFDEFAISKTEIYNLLTSHINYPVHTDGIENYYYADLENPMGGTIRIIALDVTDQDNMVYDAQHNAILSQKQIDWLCHTALKKDMTDLHSVIMLIHHPLPPDEEEIRKKIGNEYLYNWNMVPEITEAFRTKQTIVKKYRNKLLVTDSIAVNVSFSDAHGEFICYLGGHLHTYLNYEVRSNAIPSNLPKQIMIIANNMSPSEKSQTSHIERTNTGLRNNTFNIYAIDTKNKIIYVAFFGATGFYYPQIIKLPYL